MKYPKMIVVCQDSNGYPSIYPCKVACTLEEFESNEHYGMANYQAMGDGYHPLMVISEQDGAFTDFSFNDEDFR